MEARHLSCQSPEGQDAILALLEGEIAAYRGGGRYAGMFPERWLPAAIAVLEEGFSEQNRMLNSTLKVVRGRVTEVYRERLDFLFTPAGKVIGNPTNRTALSRILE
jgi:long-chain acyl-CoA synthetase